MPVFDSCINCREESEITAEKNHYSIYGGGLVCKKCRTGYSRTNDRHGNNNGRDNYPDKYSDEFFVMTKGSAMFMDRASNMELEKLSRLSVSRDILSESEKFLKASIDYHVGRDLKSRIFMDKMKRAFGVTTPY